MGKAIARRSRNALVTNSLKDPITKRYIIRHVGMLIRKELTSMCSDRAQSVLKSHSTTTLKEFTWSTLMTELSSHAPILVSILKSCTETCTLRQNRNAVIGVCCAVLLKFRYSKMCLFQKIVSLILYAGNVAKQVSFVCVCFNSCYCSS